MKTKENWEKEGRYMGIRYEAGEWVLSLQRKTLKEIRKLTKPGDMIVKIVEVVHKSHEVKK